MERWEFEDKLVDERLGAQDFANAKKVVADITIKIVTTLRWMKVEVPSPSRSPALQPPSYEDDSPEATAPSSEGQRTVRPAAGSPATTEVPPAPTDNVDEAPPVMSTQSGPDPGYDNHYPVNHDNSRRQALPGAPQLPSKIPVTVAVPAPTTSSSLVASVVETTTPPATPKGTVSPSAQPIPPPPPPPPQGNPWSVSDSPPLVRPPGSVVGNDEIGGNIVRRPDEPPSPDSLHPRGPLLPESSGSRPEVKQQTATTAPTSPSDSDPDQSGRRKSSLSVLHGQLSGGPWSSTPTLEMSANFASATRSQSYQNHLRASISSSTLSPTEKSSISDIDGLPPQQGYPPDHRGSTASLTSGAVGGPSPAGADDSGSGFSGPRDSTVIVSPMTESDSSAPWSETRGSVSTPLDWSCMLPRPISLHPLPTPTTRGLGIVRRDENTSGGPAGAKHDNDEAAMNAPQPLHPHAPPSQPRSGSSDLRRENEAPEPVIPPPCGDINPFSSGLILVDGTMGAAGPGPASSGGAGGAADLHGQALVPSAPIGPMSSFCQYRGFCSGALEVMRGGTGVKKIKKPVSHLQLNPTNTFSDDMELEGPRTVPQTLRERC